MIYAVGKTAYLTAPEGLNCCWDREENCSLAALGSSPAHPGGVYKPPGGCLLEGWERLVSRLGFFCFQVGIAMQEGGWSMEQAHNWALLSSEEAKNHY